MGTIKPSFSQRFIGGIADFTKESPIPDAYAFGRSIDVRSNPRQITILPRTIKESGTVVTDLLKWGETYNSNLTTYMYGNVGNLYSRTSAGSYTFLRQVAASHGNGMVYSAEDDFLYYSSDKVIGRYGPLGGTATFVDDFFGSLGGVPLNTNSLDLESGSSQYADRADTASLSITGNISIRAQIKTESLPAVGSSQVLVSKWNVNGNLRSYMLDIAGVSGYFGDGSDGALTISGNTTEAPVDAACTGTTGTTSLSATNASFAANQIILIHQTRGTGAGSWQRNTIAGYTAGTITTGTALNATYVSGAQVRVLKQYTNVTVNSGITYTAKAWDGTVGGILSFIASGTVTATGTISANAKGFRGGVGGTAAGTGTQGESTTGAGSATNAANGSGGGGGTGTNDGGSGGGGGSHATVGVNGENKPTGGGSTGGKGGTSLVGSADLTTMVFGGAGGGGGSDDSGTGGQTADGGNSGGIIFLTGTTVTITGAVTANGANGVNQDATSNGCTGGGGSGGAVLIKAQVATLGAALITATGGSGGNAQVTSNQYAAGTGRIHLDYYTSYTGTTSPTLDVVLDNTLVTNTSYQLRLSVSSTGTNSETLAMVFVPQTGVWQQVGVSWVASTSTATFYLNAVSLGTRVGTLTAIADTTARFAVGASFDSGGAATSFYDGLIDEVQVYNTTQTTDDFFAALASQISTTAAGLQGYWKFNDNANDATANANNLTLQGSPVYSTDVPFASPTTRLDIDQSATTAGNTYTTPTTISEGATARKTFTPAKDPQKSVAVLVAAKGTGAWTITIHDQFNNSLATSTITNANMTTGYVEFTYSANWRPLTNFTNNYHFHITSTVADGTVTTTTASDLETVSFRTYYQFLVTNTAWHPMARLLNFWVVGNERYIGKYEATLYEPNKIVLGAGWVVRCMADWREFKAFGVMKGSNIYDFDNGRVYFWDGIAPTFNFYIDIPEGGVNAMLGAKGKLYIWAGYQNQLLVYEGGDSAQKLKDFPKMETTKYAEIYPQAVTMWRSLLRYGASGNSNSANIQRGVYTYGSTNFRYDEILTYDHVISTGNYGSTVSIGLTMVVNQRLLIGYQDGTGFGVDYVDTANNPYPTATVEFLQGDEGATWKEKEAVQIVANFKALASGESIVTKYMLDDETVWTSNADATATADTILRQAVSNGRFHTLQYAIDLATTGTTSPTLLSALALDNLNEEEQIVG